LSHVIGVDNVSSDLLDNILNLKLNETFMVAGGLGLLFNIASSCSNVYRGQRAKKAPIMEPVLSLVPCVITTALHLSWLSAPSPAKSTIINSPLILPFMLIWGLQFAYQVGHMILAHVTDQPFPRFYLMWVATAAAALDANSIPLFGMSPKFQSSYDDFAVVVYMMLVVSFLMYAEFVIAVIGQITDYLGISCFRVLKRDSSGHWADPKAIDKKTS